MDHVRRSLSMAIVVIEVIATSCQFIQHTDPRFPFVYFTVWSGVFAGVVAALEVFRCSYRGLPHCRVGAAVGVTFSALIFVAIIAPATPTGTWFQPWDDAWVRVATLSFHGLAPVLVLARLVIGPCPDSIRGWLVAAYGWPVLYLVLVGVGTVTLHWGIPYPFLSPTQMGWGTVLVGIAVMATLIAVTTCLLYAAARVVSRRID
ncbi:hypothetical protein [Mycobacterium intermedium]